MPATSLLSNAERVDIVNPKRGKYFRVVADIVAERVSVGDVLSERRGHIMGGKHVRMVLMSTVPKTQLA